VATVWQTVWLANLNVLVEGGEEAAKIASRNGFVGAPDDLLVRGGI
jgi:hypothetical protein